MKVEFIVIVALVLLAGVAYGSTETLLISESGLGTVR